LLFASAQCNLFVGISPNFVLLFLFRALLAIGTGAEWPAARRMCSDYRLRSAIGHRPSGWKGRDDNFG
jgi:sugar phosphate permease